MWHPSNRKGNGIIVTEEQGPLHASSGSQVSFGISVSVKQECEVTLDYHYMDGNMKEMILKSRRCRYKAE